jgi:aspartyl-tRNA(Asn)/glutamyl-tRNA(Gln) amidotransferase subunit C
MKLSKEEVEHVALLARLALNDSEKEQFRAQLSSILEYEKIINRLDTEKVNPTYHVLPLLNISRPDQAHQPLDQDDILGNAPQKDGNYFMVPRII